MLASKAVRCLLMQLELATTVLDKGVAVLHSLNIHGTAPVQSAGSNFTGEAFQTTRLTHSS
jgi:hypothetical protein